MNARSKFRAPASAPCCDKRRSDGRKHDTGLEKPYRPKPADFRETYIRMGWDGIDQHYGTNWRVIRRWIEEEGREFLKTARAEFVRAQRRERRKRYVLGRTRTAIHSDRRLRDVGALPERNPEPDILALHEKGLSVKKIASKLGVSESRVYGALHDSGIRLTAVTNGKRKG